MPCSIRFFSQQSVIASVSVPLGSVHVLDRGQVSPCVCLYVSLSQRDEKRESERENIPASNTQYLSSASLSAPVPVPPHHLSSGTLPQPVATRRSPLCRSQHPRPVPLKPGLRPTYNLLELLAPPPNLKGSFVASSDAFEDADSTTTTLFSLTDPLGELTSPTCQSCRCSRWPYSPGSRHRSHKEGSYFLEKRFDSSGVRIHYVTSYGENVVVVGDCHELGGWDVGRAVPLRV